MSSKQGLFQVNIQKNVNDIITLDTKCTSDMVIIDLKRLIIDELKLKNDINTIQLKYNDVIMENNKCFQDYNIYDSKHIIKLYFNVQGSNKASYPPKKYSYISNDIASSFDIRAPLISKNKNELIRSIFCCSNSKHTYYSKAIFACLFGIIPFYAVTLITTTFAYKLQYNVYREYSSRPYDCVLLDPICSNKCSELSRPRELRPGEFKDRLTQLDPGTDFIWAFRMQILFALLILMLCLAKCCSHFGMQMFKICVFAHGCASVCSAIALISSCVSIIVLNSYVSWRDLVRIGQYCDKDTHFYNGIMKWQTWNIINTILTYSLLICLCGISVHLIRSMESK